MPYDAELVAGDDMFTTIVNCLVATKGWMHGYAETKVVDFALRIHEKLTDAKNTNTP
jgi:predicted methyltransferase